MKPKAFWFCLCGFLFSITFQVVGTLLLYQRDPSAYLALDNRTLITVTSASACLYICVKYVFTRHPPHPFLGRAIRRLGGLTFGIYLLGDMVIRQTLPLHTALRSRIHPLAAGVLWELLIFAACALIAAALRLGPLLRKRL